MQQSEGPNEENIIPLILEVASQFQRSGSDVQNIQNAIQDIRETETTRREIVNESKLLLQKLSRELQLSRSKGSRENVDPESLKHDTQMYEMDRKKFSIAKSIQNLDQDIASLEAEVQQLRLQSLELDSTYKSNGTGNGRTGSPDEFGMRDDDPVPDDTIEILDDTAHASAVLRLQLYRGLGIEMLENELGAFTKARIRRWICLAVIKAKATSVTNDVL